MNESTEHMIPTDKRPSSERPLSWRWWLLALAWMGGIYFLSAQSNLPLPVEGWWSGLLSWSAHFTEYAVLAGLLWLALRSSPKLARHATAIAFGLAALYALSDEVHQSFVPGRTPDVRDWLVDLAGAALAVWLLSHSRT
jgi:VanZ family protein